MGGRSPSGLGRLQQHSHRPQKKRTVPQIKRPIIKQPQGPYLFNMAEIDSVALWVSFTTSCLVVPRRKFYVYLCLSTFFGKSNRFCCPTAIPRTIQMVLRLNWSATQDRGFGTFSPTPRPSFPKRFSPCCTVLGPRRYWSSFQDSQENHRIANGPKCTTLVYDRYACTCAGTDLYRTALYLIVLDIVQIINKKINYLNLLQLVRWFFGIWGWLNCLGATREY